MHIAKKAQLENLVTFHREIFALRLALFIGKNISFKVKIKLGSQLVPDGTVNKAIVRRLAMMYMTY